MVADHSCKTTKDSSSIYLPSDAGDDYGYDAGSETLDFLNFGKHYAAVLGDPPKYDPSRPMPGH